MTLSCSVVDLSRLPMFPHYIVASVFVSRSTDRHYRLRMLLVGQPGGSPLAPPEVTIIHINRMLWLLKGERKP